MILDKEDDILVGKLAVPFESEKGGEIHQITSYENALGFTRSDDAPLAVLDVVEIVRAETLFEVQESVIYWRRFKESRVQNHNPEKS